MNKYITLLEQLISTPSLSREEAGTAVLLERFLREEGCAVERVYNNVCARSSHWHPDKPVLLLNSHHDTVRPAAGYTLDPFVPVVTDGCLYGLGSNDAGASVVSLIATFLRFREEELPFNLLLAISAEEEVSGDKGIAAVISRESRIDMALVGEPTGMQAGVGERGLVVLDCTAHGRSGHAARDEGVNALYIALDDIARLRDYRPEPVSELLGPVKFSVTQIEAGRQHNVVPDVCRFVVDVRTTDALTNEQVVEQVSQLLDSEVKARSTRLRASAIDAEHPLVRAAEAVGARPFLSPTMSDMALMPFPSLKMGPGDSARSHTADEYIRLDEVDNAIVTYEAFILALKRIIENG